MQRIFLESGFTFGTNVQRITFSIPIELRTALPEAYSKQLVASGDSIIDALRYLEALHNFSKEGVIPDAGAAVESASVAKTASKPRRKRPNA